MPTHTPPTIHAIPAPPAPTVATGNATTPADSPPRPARPQAEPQRPGRPLVRRRVENPNAGPAQRVLFPAGVNDFDIPPIVAVPAPQAVQING